MVFAGIPFWAAAAIAAASAAVLAVLHLLRVRPRPVRVVTTLFWVETVERVRARSILHRFRHPLTYALLLTICTLLALALAQPSLTEQAGSGLHEVIVLDAGASMAAPVPSSGGTRMEAAIAALEARIRTLSPSDRVAVVLVDPWPRLVLGFEQPIVSLASSLREIRPVSVPSITGEGLKLARSLLNGRANPRVLLLTDRAPADAPMGAGTDDVPCEVVGIGEDLDGLGIVSALYEPDADHSLRGRFSVRVASAGRKPQGARLEIRRAGGASLLSRIETVEPGGSVDFALSDLPADGDRLIVSLSSAGGQVVGRELVFRLPHRSPIRVGGSRWLPAAVRAAIQSDPAVQLVEDGWERDVDVVVDPPSGTLPRPSLVLRDDGPSVEAGRLLEVSLRGPLLRDVDLAGQTCGTGSSLGALSGPAEPLLVSGGAVLAACRGGKAPCVILGSALLAADSDLVRRAPFAVFLARSLRYLAGWDEDPVVLPPERVLEDPLWPRRTLLAAEVTGMPVSRAAVDLSGPRAGASDRSSRGGRRWGWSAPFEILLALALALFLLEAVLHARGRIA
ncbi:MAG TPA: VWA domain-containing protein [Phycisphaerae bacterium]|nr:VWA domain-containing protein [Phycisphaerae bacterium]HRY66547.1 VWA domain-containing protein [Phycisphaerae bacterium]HSA26967.1 VWA domain-containing protein [Phycisphaerae bacterium]